MIDAERMGRIGREQPRGEHVEAGDGKPLRAREGVASLAVVITPGIAGSGVEQHADGCQIDGDAGAFERGGTDPRRKLAPTIDTAGGKMPPATVVGNFQIGIGFAGDVGHIAGDGGEAAFIEREVRRASVGDPAVDHVAALAHRGHIVKRTEFRERAIPVGGP